MRAHSFQRRTSTPELAQLERTALHTELAELERPALTTELAQLQPSSLEASFPLGGGSFNTSPRRGGVLSSSLPSSSLTLTQELDAWPTWLKPAAELPPEREFQSSELSNFSFFWPIKMC